MPINSTHPLYDANKTFWKRLRDVFDGSDAVKKADQSYLPKPDGMNGTEYDNYKARALFYGSMGRTVQGFVGAIARKDPVFEIPTALEPMLEAATIDGMSMNETIKLMCCETLLQARGGVLVDYDEKAKMPYLAIYRTEAIVNWSDDFVILQEVVYETDPKDQFKQHAVEQYRQLYMDNGVYTVAVWRKMEAKDGKPEEWAIYKGPIQPSAKGKTFDVMPFFWLTPVGNTPRIEKPPLLDLADVCVSHYQSSADLEWGRHYTGMPTLYVTGVADTEATFRVGSTAAICLNDPHSKVAYAEFTGQGLTSIETALDRKQQMMAVLGASVFHEGPKGVEAAETARIRTSGETSLLMGVTTAVEATLKSALDCAARWASADGAKIEATLNREFVDTTIDGPTLTGLVQAFQAGAMSLPVFLYNLQQGDMLPPDTDIEEEAGVVTTEQDAKAKKAADLAAKAKGAPA